MTKLKPLRFKSYPYSNEWRNVYTGNILTHKFHVEQASFKSTPREVTFK